MRPTKKEPAREELERWENEGGSTPARLRRDASNTDPNAPRRHIHQPGHRTQGGLWGMASRFLEGVGQMFGFRRRQAP